MKELKLTTTLQIIESMDELSVDEQALVEEAKKAVSKSYAPYSRFQVGCAVRLDNGEVVSGGNQENASFPVCICAEK
jgi:cytidine deaminase